MDADLYIGVSFELPLSFEAGELTLETDAVTRKLPDDMDGAQRLLDLALISWQRAEESGASLAHAFEMLGQAQERLELETERAQINWAYQQARWWEEAHGRP